MLSFSIPSTDRTNHHPQPTFPSSTYSDPTRPAATWFGPQSDKPAETGAPSTLPITALVSVRGVRQPDVGEGRHRFGLERLLRPPYSPPRAPGPYALARFSRGLPTGGIRVQRSNSFAGAGAAGTGVGKPGAITLLVQDEVGRLEVLKDGDWVPVKPLGGDAIVVLLADQTEIITNGKRRRRSKHADSWLEDLVVLSLPLFKRLTSAMKSGDLSLEMVETWLMHYAKKYIPGISRTNRKPSSSSSGVAIATTAAASSGLASESQQRELLEIIISNLPLEKSSRPSTVTRFLFGLLRTANILNASDACKAALEKKIAKLTPATMVKIGEELQ
ncbi:BTB/POZ domain-containing protein [Pyrus ussuriensis x Pyrus communis]|uniref:BTB/POZ domain-containing protein n=1 Tax=Pyrus ussuriensis x Pyrus communis TaxID=2448454 RepID=A0A5N5GP03_9ROSA|nr:BTB/POZ domain-containing protein [Pyrus ussuriensis x Pyrus communis]